MRIEHLSANQKVLVLCVKFQDVTSTRMSDAQKWVDLLNLQVSNFYNQSTFGKSTFVFETVTNGPSDGWFQLNWNHGSPGVTGEGFYAGRHTQRTIDLVEQQADIDFTHYHRLLIITNSSNFGGNTAPGGFNLYRVRRGGEITVMEMQNGMLVELRKRYMTSCFVHEWTPRLIINNFEGASYNAAHELGHALLCKEHYCRINIPGQNRDAITPWDLMGITPAPGNMPPHHLGWSKYERGWLINDPPNPTGFVNTNRVKTVGPPTGSNINERIILKPQEILDRTGTQLILVPFRTEPPFQGYVLENRSHLNGDERIPETGVLITLVDESAEIRCRYIVLTNPRFPSDISRAPLKENDSFRDEQRNITIGVERRREHPLDDGAIPPTSLTNDYVVRLQYGMQSTARPNPIITPWGAPPWETPDIWIDSERNGWDNYKYLVGDAPWLNHVNRVYVRVRNSGMGDAINVRVEVYVSQPPSIGDARQNWNHIGSILYPIIRSRASTEGYVLWTPETSVHACIKAEIQASSNYIDMSNKTAQENVTVFDTSRSSPWKPISIKTQLHNPYSEDINVHLNVVDVPEDWAIQLDSSEIELPANGSSEIELGIFPSGSPNENDQKIIDKYKLGFLAKPKIEASIPFEDHFAFLGGVETWVHLVDKVKITFNDVKVSDQLVTVAGDLKSSQTELDKKEQTIAIEIRQKKIKKNYKIFHVQTDENGHFEAKFQSPYKGLVAVKSYFDGSNIFSEADSKEYELEII